MSLIRCAKTAAAVGKLGHQDRKEMERLWSREYTSAMDAGLHSKNAEAEANKAVQAALVGLAKQQKRVALLQQAAQTKLIEDMQRFRNHKGDPDVGQFGHSVMRATEANAQALYNLDISEIGAMVARFRKDWLTGARLNRVIMENVVREILGEDTGDTEAKAFAAITTKLLRKKVEQFNAAGGAVHVREKYMPVQHDTIRILRAGEERWKAAIRENVDLAKMVNPITGRQMTAAEFEDALTHIWEDFSTNGLSPEEHMQAQQFPSAKWRQRADPRFFEWKSADAYMAYQQEFGPGTTPFEWITGYLRSINHDIASMQTLGPNPGRTVEWMQKTILSEQSKFERGQPALFPPRNDIGNKWKAGESATYARKKSTELGQLWDQYTGFANRPESPLLNTVVATTVNVLYPAKLPFTPFYATVDMVNQAVTRFHNGLPVMFQLRDFAESLRLLANKQEIAELGLEIDTGLSILGSEMRETAIMHGQAWSRILADRVMTLGLLKPITQGGRAMFQLGNMHELARVAAVPYGDLNPRFRRMLEKYDIDEGAWEFIQATAPYQTSAGTKLIRPKDIAGTDIYALAAKNGIATTVTPRAGLTRGQEVAIRVARMMIEEGEFATVSGTILSRRVFARRAGTVSGLLVDSFAKLKTYPLSHWQHHAYRAAEIFWRNGGGGEALWPQVRGASLATAYYGVGLILMAMPLMAVSVIAQDALSGKDPQDVTSAEFWNRVLWKTVSMAYVQDMVQRVLDPDSQQGPTTQGIIIDTAMQGVAVGGELSKSAMYAMGGRDEPGNPGRAAVKLGRNLTPSTFYTNLAMNRLIWDNIQEWADPEADDYFRRQQANLRAAREQEYWWAPGDGAPERAPDMSRMDLRNEDNDSFLFER